MYRVAGMIASVRGKKPHVYRVIILKQMADHRKQQKHLEITFSYKKPFLFTRELANVRINISSNTRNRYTAENQEERPFF